MENKTQSTKFLKQRKFMVMLPLLVLPFLTMAFWALGGGSGTPQNIAEKKAGLNLQLPDANLKEERNTDKLSFYKEADADSLKKAEAMRNDPYYQRDSLAGAFQQVEARSGYGGFNYSSGNSVDANTQMVYSKIDEINRQINQPVPQQSPYQPQGYQQNSNEQFSKDVDRLQGMMQTMTNKPEKDPEMEQLNGTLEKILDIQNPERARERIRENSLEKKSQVFSVGTGEKENMETYFGKTDTTKKKKSNGFFDAGSMSTLSKQPNNAIPAVVQETQTVTTGATIKLRLLGDIYINGVLVKKGSFVYGIASLDNERLLINIPNIRAYNNLLPVSLSVYDIDGLAGIHVPGSINRDVAKQSADQTVQSFGIATLDPSLGAQAASAGIQAAKSLVGKKVKLEKVTVKAGYKILLRDNNQQN